MKNNNLQSKLFEDIENFDWREEWIDMPEFVQEDLNPKRKLIVNFETDEDFEQFIKKLELKDCITDKTKSIWFPLQEKEPPKDFGYVLFDDKKDNQDE